MNENNELPFSQVLSALFESERLPVHLVYRLSDLSTEQIDMFRSTWPEVDIDRRSAIARHMADIAEESYLVNFDSVCGFLFQDDAPAVRLAALDTVWDSTETALIPRILTLFQQDEDMNVRAAAARSLAHFILLAEWGELDPAHTDHLVDVLLGEYEKSTTSLEVKRAVLEAVAAAGGGRISDHITDAYHDGPFELQLSAVFAMGNTADERWLPILEEELESTSPEMRAEAARAIGAIGDAKGIDALQQLLSDEDTEVLVAAINALGQIGGERAFQILTELGEDPDFEEHYDVIDEALDEMDWTLGEFELFNYGEDDDEDLLDELRLN
jgi:HEAT repeat protein